MREQDQPMNGSDPSGGRTADLATEGQLLALLELPAAPASLDARILALAEERCVSNVDNDCVGEGFTPSRADADQPRLGLLIRLPLLSRAAAAAVVILAAGLFASVSEPGAEPFVTGPVRTLARLNGAEVVAAEGAYGASVQFTKIITVDKPAPNGVGLI
jgi:hypothetical protein